MRCKLRSLPGTGTIKASTNARTAPENQKTSIQQTKLVISTNRDALSFIPKIQTHPQSQKNNLTLKPNPNKFIILPHTGPGKRNAKPHTPPPHCLYQKPHQSSAALHRLPKVSPHQLRRPAKLVWVALDGEGGRDWGQATPPGRGRVGPRQY